MKLSSKRILLFAVGFFGLVLVYVFQEVDFLFFLTKSNYHPHTHFIVKKILRVLLNDAAMLFIIYSIFQTRNAFRLALFIQLIDLLFLLPLYLFLKLSIEGDSEISIPWLSQLHRLIVNPTLMILLIPALYFQNQKPSNNA